MVSKAEVWSSGVDTGFSTSLNEAIMQPLSAFDSTDNAEANITRSTDGTTAYETKRTIAIDAGAIQKYVIIRFDLRALANSAGGNLPTTNSTSGKAQITIDGTQKFETQSVSSLTFNDSGDPTTYNPKGSRLFCFKYEPTTGEKSAGFTIDLDLTITLSLTGTGTNSGTGTVYNSTWEVWGA